MEALKLDYDFVASEAVHHLQNVYGSQGDLYSQLERCRTSDPVLEHFWQVTRMIPVWVDREQIKRGQLVCKRHAIPMLIGFAFQGFAGEIAAALGPAEVLVRTGGLSQRNIMGRVKATLLWLTEVTHSPESLDVDGPGSVSTIRVRLRHAAVRQRMLAIPDSHPAFLDTTLHGIPINTYDSILTLTFFCCNPIWKQLPRLGIHLNGQEAEDLVALFRFLAYLLGVPTDYFSSAARAKKTMEDIKDGGIGPSESSKKITRDFISAFANKAPYNVSRGFLQAGIRSMNPASVCEALGVEKAGWASYIAFAGLRWSVKLMSVFQDAGFPLPPDNIMIQKCCEYLPSFEVDGTRTSEDKSICNLEYKSAFPSPRQTFRDDKIASWNQGSRKNTIYIKRPVETILLTLVGMSLLLGLTLSVVTVKLLITPRR